MEDIRIFCENDGAYHKVPIGTDLQKLSDLTFRTVFDEKSGTDIPVLAALVDNRLKELEFSIHRVQPPRRPQDIRQIPVLRPQKCSQGTLPRQDTGHRLLAPKRAVL